MVGAAAGARHGAPDLGRTLRLAQSPRALAARAGVRGPHQLPVVPVALAAALVRARGPRRRGAGRAAARTVRAQRPARLADLRAGGEESAVLEAAGDEARRGARSGSLHGG